MQPGDHFPSVVHVVVRVQPQREHQTALDKALAAAGSMCDRQQLLDTVLDWSDEEAQLQRVECGHHLLCMLAAEYAFSTGVKSNGLEYACGRWINNGNLCRAERTLMLLPPHHPSNTENPRCVEILLVLIYELMLRDGMDVVRAFVTATVFTNDPVPPPVDFDTYKAYSPVHHPGCAANLREKLGTTPVFITKCVDYVGRVYMWCLIDGACRGKGRGRDALEAENAAANEALKWLETQQPMVDRETYEVYSSTDHIGCAAKLRLMLRNKRVQFATDYTDCAGRVYVGCFVDGFCRGKGRGRDGTEAYDAAASVALKWAESMPKKSASGWSFQSLTDLLH